MYWLWLWICVIWIYLLCTVLPGFAASERLYTTVAKTGLSSEDGSIVQGRIIKKHCIILAKSINPWDRSTPLNFSSAKCYCVTSGGCSLKKEVSEWCLSHMAEVRLQASTASVTLSLVLSAQWVLNTPSPWITTETQGTATAKRRWKDGLVVSSS